ncbi:hypothetical protein ACIP6T_00275 [Pantoea sp. NPDC088449]|uniref:Uncharacterized protein n=1 Tax=Candidatus Pantoea floridensis TaxID=1938870 RepID=A0A286BR55_9GAMM|nr:hypothetical protein [Pantoea floridensis]PIF23181.1 hypothetical protein BX596_2616 [Enterobacteriaceae bacterium JKS000233]SOD36635.1 hypothetical protein SAMN06273570_0940 [Pantoea floridensis]HBZ17731.1 hypothetical protein [Pantoea sp.]
MAIIQYGKSVFSGNTRTRRHRRRQSISRLKRSIDSALGIEPDNITLRTAERICQRQTHSRVDCAVLAPTRVQQEQASFDNCCLPHVYLYAVR